MPVVSVIIPSFNHETFIEQAIQSVLNQSFQDFEIVITDDGSTDNSLKKIKGFTDPRLRILENYRNRGGSFTTNRCIKQSSGKYIAMLSSDDSWLPEKLERQVQFMDANPHIFASFTKVNWIDEQNNLITQPDFDYHDVFDVDNRTRFEWLNHFFFHGNCLCHPSSLVRREVYSEIGLFNPWYANLPDLDFWTRLLLKHEIYILEDRLVNFRHFRDEVNVSGDIPTNNIRISFEARHILNHYKTINDLKTYIKVFPTADRFTGLEREDLNFLLGLIAIGTGMHYKVLWGQDLLLKTLSDPFVAERISRKFGFDYPDFFKVTGAVDYFGLTSSGGKGNSKINPQEQIVDEFQMIRFPRNRDLLTKILQRVHLQKDVSRIKQSQEFDYDYYLSQNPDVKKSGMDPLKHYLLHGSDEGRNPNKKFITRKYVSRYLDVQNSRMNPLLHFILYGKKENRNPS